MSEQIQKMIDFVVRDVIRNQNVQIDVNTPLVSSGLIDSFALVDILLTLEDLTNTRIPAGKVQAKDMDTISLMFATAARVGKPRNV
jgi:acyl carrier protein